MKRLLVGVILVTGCGVEPSAPRPLLSYVASTLTLDHSAFTSLEPVDRPYPDPDCFGCVIQATPIGHATDYFYVAHATRSQGDGKASVSLPVGTPINGLSANVYLDSAGLTGGSGRTIDVYLVRFGNGAPFPAAFVTVTVDHTRPTSGWRVVSNPASGTIESGVTYQVIANLRGDPPPHHRLRVASVDIAYGTTPAPMTAAVMDPATRARFADLSRNLAARQLMP